ncbi:MAG: PepSY domain-containing protein [Chloroflexi bacterium]|nr:PepSY domain-containing protein [Chloroflexota bacterium]
MTQRNSILIAALLTSFMLVLIGGVVARVTQAGAAAEAAPTTTVSTQAAATLAPDVQALITQREAQYQQALQDANAQLQQAYQQQQELAAQLAQQQAQPQTPTYAVWPDMAASIALNATPGTTVIRMPELVNFQGAVAYEVTLDRGKVYVDANNGNVLHNGAAPATNSGQGGHDDDGHDNDHEGGDD